jgi:uncharacterized protein YhaN
MRIRRLELLKYGHFTNAGFDLPQHAPDFHMVFGLNEAGKSTAQCAIEDLLFGIAHNSPLNFLHDYPSIRLGAIIEADSRTLAFRRRKGNRDTILGSDDLPIVGGDAALASFLGGVEKRAFARMFSLDHTRLREGGRDILEAQDDVGQILYAATAGVVGLRRHIAGMNDEANALWARRASQRKYNAADEKLKAAEQALRDHTVTASQWNELRKALEEASERYSVIEAEIETKGAEQRKLSRIRRVFRHVRGRAELRASIESLAAVPALPKDSSETLESALHESNEAATRLSAAQEQIDALTRERAGLQYDETLLARADDIDQLHERRIQIRGEMADLPKRKAELNAAKGNLLRLATELEWPSNNADEIVDRIPARAKLAHARTLSNRRGELATSVANAQTAVEDAEDRTQAIRDEIRQASPVTDMAALAATIGAIRERGDLASRAAALEGEGREAGKSITELLAAMRPRVADAEALAAMDLPPKGSLEAHRDAARGLAQKRQGCRDRLQNAERELLRITNAYQRLVSDEQAIPAEELRRLRAHREAGWSIIRRKYIDGVPVGDDEIQSFGSDESIADAYQQAVETADDAADMRLEKATIIAELTVRARQIEEAEELLESLRAEEQFLSDDGVSLDSEWLRMWGPAGLAPLSPDAMLEWVELRSRILQITTRQSAAEREARSLREEETGARDLLIKELKGLGIDTAQMAARPLRVVIEFASQAQRQNESQASAFRALEERLAKAVVETTRKRKALETAEAQVITWRGQWSGAITALGLNAASPVETLNVQINAIDELREVANRISYLCHERIEKIERDIAAFSDEVSQVLEAVEPALVAQDPQDAVLEIERQLAESRKAFDLATVADERLADARAKAEQCGRVQEEAGQSIEVLQRTAGVATLDDLREAIARADRRRSMQHELETVNQALLEDSDGLAIADVVAECVDANLDEIAAREQTMAQDLGALRERLMEARDVLSGARRAFEVVGGSDRAARAASDRQSALSEMQQIAEDYVSIRTGVVLLEWAIERYRREKQAPLLKRAGALFAKLTGGSFKELKIEFGEHDKMHLTGLRSNDTIVPVSGMSDGTADQLYLALKVAAVEDSLSHGIALPFVADDLFINFDGPRAAAGFGVLAELARKTQVLFFTHHEHLVQIARQAIGEDVPVITLAPAARPAIADDRNSRAAA